MKYDIKPKWQILKGAQYAILGEDTPTNSEKCVPITVFYNWKTGEIKLYSSNFIEEKGVNNILKTLK